MALTQQEIALMFVEGRALLAQMSKPLAQLRAASGSLEKAALAFEGPAKRLDKLNGDALAAILAEDDDALEELMPAIHGTLQQAVSLLGKGAALEAKANTVLAAFASAQSGDAKKLLSDLVEFTAPPPPEDPPAEEP